MKRFMPVTASGLFIAALFAILALEEAPPGPPSSFPDFSAHDILGRPQTGEIFRRGRLTAVIIWQPSSEACVRLISELSGKRLPDGAKLAGLVVGKRGLPDESDVSAAREIASKAGADVIHIIANEDFSPILASARALPITFFTSEDGSLAGYPVAGDSDALVTEELERLLSSSPEREASRQRIQSHIFR